ncbi:hypothetical protein EOL96_04630 [Candidatus Saccharibacteria bacterium]|nr:hypothetical protein [Candidatus Saccharibacteria bacterium]
MKITKRISLRKPFALVFALLFTFASIGAASGHIFAAQTNTTDLNLLSESWSFDSSYSYFAVKDGITYKADYMSDTLRAIDARDPQNIQTISVAEGQIPYPDRVFIIGNYAYVQGLESRSINKIKIAIFDISDPYNIVQVGTFSDPAVSACTSYGTGTEKVGASLVLNLTCTNQIVVLDLTNPIAPTVGGFFDYSTYKGTAFYKVSTTDTGIGFNFYQTGAAPTYSYIEVDVTDTSNPTLFAAVPSAPLGLLSYGSTGGRQLQSVRIGQYLYLAQQVQNSNTDFYVIDITDPSSPIVVYSNIAVPACWFDMIRQVENSSLLLKCSADTGPTSLANSLIDITTPSAPTFGPSFGLMGNDDTSEIDDGKLYISSGYNLLQLAVYDLTSPTQKAIFLGGLHYNLGEFYSMTVVVPNDTTALLLSQEELAIQTVDITDPNNITTTSTQFLTEPDGSTPRNYANPKVPQLSSSGNSLYLLERGITTTTWTQNGFLTLIDISDTDNIQLATRIPGPSNEMIVSGKVVGNTWYTLSISRTTAQTILRSYNINETTKQITELDSQVLLSTKGTVSTPLKRDVEIIGNSAIILAHQQQIEVVDVTDPSNLGAPVLSNLPALNNFSLGNPFAYGSQLLVPVAGYLYSIDATNPLAMTISSTITNPLFTLTTDRALVNEGDQFQTNIANTLIYTNQNGDSHARLNMTDPQNPELLDSVNGTGLFPPFLDGWENVEEHAIFFRGDYAYAVTAQGDSSFYTFDASDFTQPRPLDNIVNLVPTVNPTSMAFYNDYAYLGSYDSWEVDAEIAAYTIADPRNPQVVGGPIHEYNNTYDMDVQGQYLYASQSWGGMTVYDLTNPTFPRAIGRHEGALYRAYDMKVNGQYAYFADSRNGLVIFDISDPTAPTHVSTFEDANFTSLAALEVNGNYIYGLAPTENAMIVLDVSNPSAPTTVATISEPQFDGLDSATISDGYLYVTGLGTNTGANVTIFDISSAAAPVQVGSYVSDTSSIFEDIVVAGNTAFVAAAGNNSIDLIDITNKESPELIRRVTSLKPSLNYVRKLNIHNDVLYSAARDGQSMNAYEITIASAQEPETPETPADPSTSTPGSVPLVPNTGITDVAQTLTRYLWPLVGAFTGLLALTAFLVSRSTRGRQRGNQSR